MELRSDYTGVECNSKTQREGDDVTLISGVPFVRLNLIL